MIFSNIVKHLYFYFIVSLIVSCNIKEEPSYSYKHPILFTPQSYICYKTNQAINIDGILSDSEWNSISWTDSFVDIQGALKQNPSLHTQVKMTWDESYFYFGALLQEPHIWATLTERDAIIYHDDDFEIFIDPDSDGHNYLEFEMNAFNTIWDLLMLYPYGLDDRRNYIMNWDIRGIKSAVHINGTINNPTDIDSFWSLEVAIPWDTFRDLKKGEAKPQNGDQWRVNFSRVDWPVSIQDNTYKKKVDKNGKILPENNWVWSPTGFINMHKPETWGYVQFETKPNQLFNSNEDEKIIWALWQIYYQIKECVKNNKTHCLPSMITIPDIEILKYSFEPDISIYKHGFYIHATTPQGKKIILDHKGQLERVNF